MKRAKNIYFGNTPVVKVLLDSNVVWPIGSIIEPDVAKPANNEIWYTNGSTTAATAPYETTAFNANIVSNKYDTKKKCWVITFNRTLTKIGTRAFFDRNLTTIVMPDSVTTIGQYAFHGSDLTSVTIGSGVTEIGEYAFYSCFGLTTIVIPNNVTFIRRYAFYHCENLTTVTIGTGLISIEMGAFAFCLNLISVYCKAPNPPTADYNTAMFDYNATGRKIYVPKAVLNSYKGRLGWNLYADAIVGYDF